MSRSALGPLLFSFCSILLAGFGILSQTACDPSGPDRLAAGSNAPDFTLPLFESERETVVTLSEVLQEQPVLLAFWASWCPSCVGEIPMLNEWQDAYGDRELKILSVNVEESRPRVEEFLKKHPLRYPILMDETGETARRYGLAGIPAAVFVTQQGKIIYFSFSLPHNMPRLLQENRDRTAGPAL